jgi:predicted DNA-binding protein
MMEPMIFPVFQGVAAMSDLVLTLTPEAQERLEALAAQLGRSVDDCLHLALTEFMDNWEDYLRTLATLDEGEERPVLRAVND